MTYIFIGYKKNTSIVFKVEPLRLRFMADLQNQYRLVSFWYSFEK